MITPEELKETADMWDGIADLCDKEMGKECAGFKRNKLEGIAAAFRNCAAWLRLKAEIHCHN